jgi:hypothetical protein
LVAKQIVVKNLDLEIRQLNTVPDLEPAPSFDSAIRIETNINSSSHWIRIQMADFYPKEKKIKTVSDSFQNMCCRYCY